MFLSLFCSKKQSRFIYEKFYRVLKLNLLLLSFISVSSFSLENNIQTISLLSENQLENRTLVTFGVPFAPGQLENINKFRLFDEQGKEVEIFVKPTLYWHWKKGADKTIRAIKVQFYLKKGTVKSTYSFTYNSYRNSSRDIRELPYDLGTKKSLDPKKAKMSSPIVTSILSSQWLEQSRLIPPYISMNKDNQMTFWNTQLEWAKRLDFTKNNIADWLFDRVSALYKGCMRSGDVECYREAFLSYRYWNKHIKRKGGFWSCRGGLDISSNKKKACDNKYVYIEPIKIHTALTGDDELHDEQLIKDMSELAYDNNWQGASYDLYDSEKEVFTERHTGLTLLTLVNGYELVNDTTILKYINKHIDSLYQHQNKNPDGLPSDGSFRHSWRLHEGDGYVKDGDLDDRRFSPWMTENISDALWQAYHILGDERIPEMLSFIGEALDKWGFANSYGYTEKFGKVLHDLPKGQAWKKTCNKGDIVLYSGSSVASANAIINTQNSRGWYSDSHTPEAIFSLSVAYYFEKSPLKSKAIKNRITNLYSNYIRYCGGSSSKTKRSFNWSNRSNYWGTYLWALTQKGEELPVKDLTDNVIQDTFNTFEVEDSRKKFKIKYIDSFIGKYRNEWLKNDKWYVDDGALYANGYGLISLDSDIGLGNNYRIEVDFTLGKKKKLDKSIVFATQNEAFYTARVVTGEYGGIYLYKHISKWDMGGKVIQSKRVPISFIENYKLVTLVEDRNVKVYLNNRLYLSYSIDSVFSGKNIGIFSQGGNSSVEKFSLEY